MLFVSCSDTVPPTSNVTTPVASTAPPKAHVSNAYGALSSPSCSSNIESPTVDPPVDAIADDFFCASESFFGTNFRHASSTSNVYDLVGSSSSSPLATTFVLAFAYDVPTLHLVFLHLLLLLLLLVQRLALLPPLLVNEVFTMMLP